MGTQDFGGNWTLLKLDAVDGYLKFYTTALKKQNFKLCYIDAFAGSGSVVINSGEAVEGSALRALRYPFDRYYFFEKNQNYCNELREKITGAQSEKVHIHNADCNELLRTIDTADWIGNGWRGVIFLDPYAMNLTWECLEKISTTQAFDVWYLFPFSALNRNLFNNKPIPDANKQAITRLLGTTEWEKALYKESAQLSFFETNYEKERTDGIRDYILERMGTIFPTVSPEARFLRNEKNSPVFLLCFLGSNPSKAARGLSLKAANHILSHL